MPMFPDPEELLAHDGFVRSVARRLVADENVVDDVVQKTWIAALAHRPSGGSLRAWLATAARRFALDIVRGDRRRREREQRAAAAERMPSMDEVFAREAVRRRLLDATARLPEPMRGTFLLRYYEGLPPRAIARRLDVPVDTVKSRLRRALEQLRAEMNAQDRVQGKHWSVWASAIAYGPAAAPAAPILTSITSKAASLAAMSTRMKTAATVIALSFLTALLWPLLHGSPAAPQEKDHLASSLPAADNKQVPAPETEEAATAGAGGGARRAEPSSAPAPAKPKPAAESTPRVPLRVHVSERKTHRDVEGVGVLLQPIGSTDRPRERFTALTNREGTASFEGVPAQQAIISIDRSAPNMIVSVAADASKPLEVEIEPGRTYDVTAVTPGGSPAAGASVYLSEAYSSIRDTVCVGATDADGKILIKEVSKECVLTAGSAQWSPSAPVLLSPQAAPAGDEAVPLRIVLGDAAASAVGTIVGYDGRAVAGAAVLFGKDDAWARVDDKGRPVADDLTKKKMNFFARTDAKGRFQCAGLEAGNIAVAVRADGYGTFADVFEFEAGKAREMMIKLPKPAAVAGRVADSQGNPLRYAAVYSGVFGSFLSREAHTGADGLFRLDDLGPGSIECTAYAGEKKTIKTTLVLEEGKETEWNPTFAVAPSVRGRVVDGAGLALEGWRVRAVPTDMYGAVMGGDDHKTDARGAFEIRNLKDSDYCIDVMEPRAAGANPDAFDFSVPSAAAKHVRPGGPEIVIRVTDASRPNVTILGRVVDADGNPAVGAVVSVEAQESRSITQLPVLESGSFKYGPVSADKQYRIGVAADGYAPIYIILDDLAPKETRDLGVLRLGRGSRLHVHLPAGVARDRARVGLRLERRQFSIPASFELKPAGDGFDSGPLSPGKYILEASCPGFCSERIVVDVAAGSDANATLAGAPGDARTLSLRDAAGRGLGAVVAEFYDASGRLAWDEVVYARAGDDTAEAAFTLPAGKYQLKLRTSSGAAAEAVMEFGAGAGPMHVDLQ